MRRERMLAWQSGEYADECHERWSNRDMLWAYNYGFKHGLEKKQILPKEIKRPKATKAYRKVKEALSRLRKRNLISMGTQTKNTKELDDIFNFDTSRYEDSDMKAYTVNYKIAW